MKSIRNFPRKKISLEELTEYYHISDYNSLYENVSKLVAQGELVPIKSSKLNGMSRPLYCSYRILDQMEDHSDLKEELQYHIYNRLSIDYYMNHLDQYKKDREMVLLLSEYLKTKSDNLQTTVSINERSFEIFGREKFLLKEGGSTLLKNLNMDFSDLNVYPTTEPLPYYSVHKKVPQEIIIVENKDTFYSMRKHLIEGNHHLIGVAVGTVIYGKGKGIIKSFQDFEYCVEPYLTDEKNIIYYFGDLDYEGIKIFETLYETYSHAFQIKPFLQGYEKMIEKAKQVGFHLPFTKEGQKENIKDDFLGFFSDENQKFLINLLESRRYIPQEILNQRDF